MDIEELRMLLSTMDPAAYTEADFKEATERTRGMKHLKDEARLQLYGLYKQALEGDNTTPQPWAVEFVAKAKWNAWHEFKGFPKNSAMLAYCYIVENMLGGSTALPGNAGSALGLNGAGTDMGFEGLASAMSMPKTDTDAKPWGTDEMVFDAVSSGDITKVRQAFIDAPLGDERVNQKDETGMTPLHYAADLGAADICKLLVDMGADAHATDTDGMTPAMFAAQCGHLDVLRLLKAAGANMSAQSEDGQTIEMMVDTISPEDRAEIFAS